VTATPPTEGGWRPIQAYDSDGLDALSIWFKINKSKPGKYVKASKPPRSTALSSSKLTVLLAALVFSLTACDLMSAEDSKTPSIQQNDKPAQATRSGEQVFADTCAFCHGHFIAPGLSVGPELRGRNLPAALTKTFVRNGVGAMPAFRPTEILSLIHISEPTRPY